MANNFISQMVELLAELISPSSAEAKIIAGDQEAADLIAETRDPNNKQIDPLRVQTVFSTAEKLSATTRIYGNRNRPGGSATPYAHYFPVDIPKSGGLKDNIHIDVNFPTVSRYYLQETLLHELGHFLDFRGQESSIPPRSYRQPDPNEGWVSWLLGHTRRQRNIYNREVSIYNSQLKNLKKVPRPPEIGAELMADILAGSPLGMYKGELYRLGPEGAERLKAYVRAIFGTDFPFDRETQ